MRKTITEQHQFDIIGEYYFTNREKVFELLPGVSKMEIQKWASCILNPEIVFINITSMRKAMNLSAKSYIAQSPIDPTLIYPGAKSIGWINGNKYRFWYDEVYEVYMVFFEDPKCFIIPMYNSYNFNTGEFNTKDETGMFFGVSTFPTGKYFHNIDELDTTKEKGEL